VNANIIEFLKKYYLYIGIGLFALISLVLTIDIDSEEVVADLPVIYDTENQLETYIYVDIRGSVSNPGVYKVEDGTRLFQLISLAGGLTMHANELVINQSQLLTDEMFVYIPNVIEVDNDIPIIDGGNTSNANDKIDINSATNTELETLPGIGPSTSKNIIDYRTEISEFETTEDIMNVPGIGEATYNEIKDLITT
jgi:competence protein ComEA